MANNFLSNLSNNLKLENFASDHKDVFNAFTIGLEQWSLSGHEPKEADQDVRYFMDLQHKRVQERGLSYQLDFESSYPINSAKKFVENWKLLGSMDQVYFSQSQHYQAGILGRRYYIEDQLIHEKKSDVTFFQSILEPTDAQEGLEELNFVCDNCGYISKIGQLIDACPSCGTHYKLGDFYFRVSNFWFIPNLGEHEGSKIVQAVKLAFILTFILTNIFSIFTGEFGLISIIAGIFLGAVMVPIVFLIANILFMGKAVKESASALNLARQSKGSRAKTSAFLQKFDPAFNFDYFEHKTLSLLRVILFHPTYQNIPQFKGHTLPEESKNILDIQYRGNMSLDSFEERGENIEAEIGVHVLTTYFINKKITEKKELFQMKMIHKAKHLANPGFSIKKITCKSCGGSFDASNETACPYCSTQFDVSEEDWLVVSIEKA